MQHAKNDAKKKTGVCVLSVDVHNMHVHKAPSIDGLLDWILISRVTYGNQ